MKPPNKFPPPARLERAFSCQTGESMPIDPQQQKEAMKEAIREWLDDAFAEFGKWTLKGLAAAALCGLFWLALVSAGWHK
ncbi:MAG: hypothetical protein V4508_02205 [Pseudomonadota bacterium]